MKKLFMISSAVMLLTAASANAEVSLGVNIGGPAEPVYAAPVYAAPQPGYVVAPDWPSQHYDIHRHRHNDYWAHREHDERARHHG